MMSPDPRIDPGSANIVNHNTNQPYARRSVKSLLFLVMLLVAIGIGLGWFFYYKSNNTDGSSAPQMPGNQYESGGMRSGLYDFFYNIFDGNNPAIENTGRFAAQKSTATPDTTPQTNFSRPRHAISNILDSPIYDVKDEMSGTIHDILVNKDTGEALLVVMQEDGTAYQEDFRAVSFGQVLQQDTKGKITLTKSERAMMKNPTFNYEDVNLDEYISLRHIQAGQVLDVDGRVAGDINTVIYEDAEARAIYFTVWPALSTSGISTFYLPFTEAHLEKNKDGYDIRLTKAQTEALAAAVVK